MRKLSPPKAFVTSLLKERNELRRKMLLLGYLSERLSKTGVTVYLVGGQAVETYTGGIFTTGDVDITTTDTRSTETLLKELGFSREGMVWVNARLGIVVHLVSDYPSHSTLTREIEVSGYTVRVVGVEDLIIDRLNAGKHWKSDRDTEQARALYMSFEQDLDLGYLRKRAKEELVDDLLEKVMKRSSSSRFGT